jgi:hypothetical protein
MKKKRKINEILIMIYFRIVHIQNKKTIKGKIENSKFQKKKNYIKSNKSLMLLQASFIS